MSGRGPGERLAAAAAAAGGGRNRGFGAARPRVSPTLLPPQAATFHSPPTACPSVKLTSLALPPRLARGSFKAFASALNRRAQFARSHSMDLQCKLRPDIGNFDARKSIRPAALVASRTLRSANSFGPAGIAGRVGPVLAPSSFAGDHNLNRQFGRTNGGLAGFAAQNLRGVGQVGGGGGEASARKVSRWLMAAPSAFGRPAGVKQTGAGAAAIRASNNKSDYYKSDNNKSNHDELGAKDDQSMAKFIPSLSLSLGGELAQLCLACLAGCSS